MPCGQRERGAAGIRESRVVDLQLRRDGVVVPVRTDPAGLVGPTPRQVRGPKWRRTSPGFFVPADVIPDEAEQRIVEAVAGAPKGMAATGWAALHWQGAGWFPGKDSAGTVLPVPVALNDQRSLSRREGVQLCHDWLFDDDLIEVDGLPLTRPERSVCSAALRARSLESALQVIEMALAADLVSVDELRTYASRLFGRPHTRRLNAALVVAEENVWSPMEVTMRLRWVERRPASLLCNVPVFDRSGNHLFTPDLFDPETGVAGQYDGRVHDERTVRRRDLDKEEMARVHAIEVVSMISTDLTDMVSFERRLEGAYRRAAGRTGEPSWSLVPPDGWVDTSTVERRRSLTSEQRARWLKFQRSTPH